MSALGHYLEEEGLATVVIALIRPQAENTKPPRALWVPFELGRPFGPPRNPAFQKRVMLTALRMLERDDGPVLIEDFIDDDPRSIPDPAWQPPLMPAMVASGPVDSVASRMETEILSLHAAHQRWMAQYRRTTLGLSGIEIAECARYVGDWLRGQEPPSPRDGFSAPLMLRFAVDDLKAFCLEGATAGDAQPSSRQLGDWFWNETATGEALHALRAMLLRNPDERLSQIVSNFIVPAARVRLG